MVEIAPVGKAGDGCRPRDAAFIEIERLRQARGPRPARRIAATSSRAGCEGHSVCPRRERASLASAFDEDGRGQTFGAVIKDASPVGPWLWCLEVKNAILVKERRKVVSQAEGARLFGLLDDLGIELTGEPAPRRLASLAQLARSHDLSSYDAVYLELAIALALPLFTTDVALKRAATSCGVPLVWSLPE